MGVMEGCARRKEGAAKVAWAGWSLPGPVRRCRYHFSNYRAGVHGALLYGCSRFARGSSQPHLTQRHEYIIEYHPPRPSIHALTYTLATRHGWTRATYHTDGRARKTDPSERHVTITNLFVHERGTKCADSKNDSSSSRGSRGPFMAHFSPRRWPILMDIPKSLKSESPLFDISEIDFTPDFTEVLSLQKLVITYFQLRATLWFKKCTRAAWNSYQAKFLVY